ncbi:MAG: addiction module protein [Acidiferrobacterales bacterium]|nr:addiction module protein [Acidiferrobacterales bacterium]
MGNITEKLNIDLSQLSVEEKAELAHLLIEELEDSGASNMHDIWLKEAEERYEQFKNGDISADTGSAVFERARDKLA